MKAKRSSHYYLGVLCAAIVLLMSACQPAAVAATAEPTQTPAQPTATPAIVVTQTPAQATQTASGSAGDMILDYLAVAQNVTVETAAAVPASAGGPWWESAPEHLLVTLQGYPVSDHTKKAQIFIYPAASLAAANENMGKAAADLQDLLQTRQVGMHMPFLPLSSDTQVMNVQMHYLDFKSGKGVRYLTQLNNGIVPVNNHQMIYTFQGLTSDGKYYIAAVLPVTHPELPANESVPVQAGADYRDNLAKTVTLLEQQPSGSFTPDLAELDKMIESIEIK